MGLNSKTAVSASGDNAKAAGRDINNINLVSPTIIFDPKKLADIIDALDTFMISDEKIRLDDFTRPDIEEKNKLNKISNVFYNEGIKEDYEYFSAIDAFFKDPSNGEYREKYKKILWDVRKKIIARQNAGESMENIISTLFDFAQQTAENRELFKDSSLVNILSSYMYVNCDIGRKTK